MKDKSISSIHASPIVIQVAALAIILAGMFYAKSIITLFLLAIFISIICIQPISWLEKKRVPKWLALILVIMGLIVIFAGFTFLIGETLSSFSSNVSKYESTLTTISSSFIQFLNEKGLKIPDGQLSNLIQPAKILEFTANAVNAILSMMGNTFMIFLVVLFILMEFGSFSVKAKAILHGSDAQIAYFSTIIRNVRQYLWLKTIVGLSEGILIYLGLLIIGVDYPLLWALIAFLMNYIPNIGSILASIPTILFALVQLGLTGALWTLGMFVFVHNVIGNFLEPKIMGRGLGLSTLVVFLSLIFWGFILGTVGMFLSVPFTMTIKIILEQNEKTRWIAILLGTPAEAKIYLHHAEDSNRQKHKNPLVNQNQHNSIESIN
jgi:AI-2 transport protein TqsA